MDEVAGYKIITILLEYEDKFPYRKHKIIRHPLAFSEKEVKMLVKTAEENCIQIIPLLQSLGHVEYVLKHNHYRTLRERKNDPYQYCPSNPGSFRMFRELADQMRPFHGNGRYFHVGGDETYFLGECETCRKKSARQGEKPLLYINHMNKICDFVLSAGKKPILWSDMLVDFPQHIGKLNRDAVVMYWNYGPFDSIVPWVHWKGRVYFKDDLDDIPSEVIRTYLPYWNGGRFPEFMNAFPYTGFFRDHGRDVIAAPIADQSHTLLNTAAFATNAAENAALGMVTTGWPLFPAYHLRAGFVAAADKAWNSNSRDLTKRLNWRFFGVTSDESAHLTVALKTRFPRKAGSSQTKARRTLTKYLREPAKNGRLLEKLRLAAEHKRYSDKRNILLGRAAEVSQHLKTGEWNEFVEIINYDREKIPFTFRELKTLTNGLRRLEGTLAALEARTREVMTDTASSAAIEEYLAALYRYDREKLRKLIPPLRLLLAGERITREDMP